MATSTKTKKNPPKKLAASKNTKYWASQNNKNFNHTIKTKTQSLFLIMKTNYKNHNLIVDQFLALHDPNLNSDSQDLNPINCQMYH